MHILIGSGLGRSLLGLADLLVRSNKALLAEQFYRRSIQLYDILWKLRGNLDVGNNFADAFGGPGKILARFGRGV
jgi:hypothetical protein